MQQPTSPTKHPYRFTALLMAAIVLVYLAAGTAAALLKLPASNTSDVFLLANLGLAILGAALLTGLRWWRVVGFRAPAAPRDLRLYWLPCALVLVNLASGIALGFARMGLGRVAYFIAMTGLIGFVEEVFFRGLILRALASRGLWRAALVSAVLFGLAHSLNALSGANTLAIALQIGYALAIGFGFAAVTLRTGILWPLVLIHALIDLASFLVSDRASAGSPTTVDMVFTILTIVVFTGYGIVMMRAGQPLSRDRARSLALAEAAS
jgi:membrane protease YdiL (CAAX protease family)